MDIDIFEFSLKKIINLGIAEIHKKTASQYVFRVFEKWYELSYKNDYGAFLQLTTGTSKSELEEIVYTSEKLLSKTEKRKSGDKIIKSFEEIYLSHLFFNSEKLTHALTRYILLLPKISLLEKLSDDLFIIDFEEEKFTISRNKIVDTVNLSFTSILEIKHSTARKEKKMITEQGKIDEIFATLNALYFLNTTRINGFSDTEIMNLFR